MELTKQDLYVLGQSEIREVESIGDQIQLNLELEPQEIIITGSVSGSVSDGAAGINGAYVKIMDSSYNPISHAVTDENGYFNISNLPANATYYAFCNAPGKCMSRSSLFSINPFTATTLDPIILSDNPKADDSIIAGNIFNIQTELPISNALVTLIKVEDNGIRNILAITYSNQQGQFVFRDLDCTNESIQYEISISSLGYFDTSTTLSIYGACQIGFVQIPMTINPKLSNGTLSGIITDPSGVVKDADVILYTIEDSGIETPIAFTTTDANGVYIFFNVEPGIYLVKSNQMMYTEVSLA